MSQWFSQNANARLAFLSAHHIDLSSAEKIAEDGSSRHYLRYQQGERSVILMEAVPDTHPDSMAGHKTTDFVTLSNFLRERGIHTPEIYEADHANGILLLEDFGDITFKEAAQDDPESFYRLATETLIQMRNTIRTSEITQLPNYYDSPVHKGRRRLVDWYIPAIRNQKNPDGLADEYLAAWEGIEDSLPPCPQGFCHIDFHFENLMWMAKEKGIARCGVLDFQGAMKGPIVYDIGNLLEDARVIVPDNIRQDMLSLYTKDMTAEDKDSFHKWYRVITTQFHCRVIGQFIKIGIVLDKPRYMAFLPNIMHYLNEALADPLLAPVQKWFKENQVTFDPATSFDLEAIRNHIRADAF